MTIASWLRSLTFGSASALKESRRCTARRLGAQRSTTFERLENRTLMSSSGLGLDFAHTLGSAGSENGLGLATDTLGNVVVAGGFSSASMDPDSGPGTYLLTNTGGSDGYAAKYDPAGNLLWGVQVGGAGNGGIGKVEMDGAGNLLIAGTFTGSADIGAPGQSHVTLTNGGSNDGFLAKFDSAGNALWATTLGVAADPRSVHGITTDAAGNVYATGYEGNRLFVAKYSANGAAVWTQVVSGAGTLVSGTFVAGESVAVDAAGNVLVVGPYSSKIDFNPDPTKTNFLTSINRHPYDNAFVLKLNTAGTYVWAGSMGGPGGDLPNGLAVDGAGNVFVSGIYGSGSQNDFDPGPGTVKLPGSGGTFVVKLDPNMNLIWARSLAVYNVRDMALDAAGNVYTTGLFSGTFDFDPGQGTFNLTTGAADAYVSKLDSSGNFVSAADIVTSVPGSAGNPFNIAVDGSGNIYTSGFIKGTVDFDPGAGTYSLTSTPDSTGIPTMDAFVSKLSQVVLPPPATLSISDATVTEGNTGTILAIFIVTRSGDSGQEVNVAYNTADQSSAAGVDYAAVSGTLIFAAGETSKTISIAVNGDRLVEPNETFSVDLSVATNALIADSQGVGTIMDDEPRISINDVSKNEGSKNATAFTFTVTLSGAYDQPVTLNYATTDGSATVADGDYVSAGGTLTFLPGETSKTITIQVKGDRSKEANETFYLDLFGNSSNSLFTRSHGIGTILNDD